MFLWDIRCLNPASQSTLLFFQRIEGRQISNSLSMFGQSISGQIDADNNGYLGEYKIDYILYIEISTIVGAALQWSTYNW